MPNNKMADLVLLMKYRHILTKHVEAEIQKTLPDKFALVMDGWTATNSSYFVALFATFPSKDVEIGYETVLLTFSPLLIERRSREEHQELIKYALDLYGKSAENVVAITADNCKLNQCIADHIDIPMVGCAIHRFILAVQGYINKHKDLIQKVHNLMFAFKISLKLRDKLALYTPLAPIPMSGTCWLSVADMLARYNELREFLHHFETEAYVLEYSSPSFKIPDVKENKVLSDLHEEFQSLKSITLALQAQSTDMVAVRMLFDGALSKFPNLDEKSLYLSPDSEIVHSPHFEAGLVKIQDGRERDLCAQ